MSVKKIEDDVEVWNCAIRLIECVKNLTFGQQIEALFTALITTSVIHRMPRDVFKNWLNRSIEASWDKTVVLSNIPITGAKK